MGPKKKGKANKLAKMSEEEKARYLQHRADMEEEARRRKQELIGRYMKNKLQKEEAYAKINFAKINQQWRFILRKLKVKDLHSELEMMSKTFVRTLERKNIVIKKLLDSLDESEEQYSYMLQSHMELINQFLEMKDDRLRFFQDSYEEQKFTLMDQWDEELQNIEMSQKDAEKRLTLMIYQQDEDMKEKTKKIMDVKGHLVNYIAITLEHELNDMILPKQLQLEAIWDDMRQIFGDYVSYHSPKIQQYQLLRQKDATNRKEIHHNMELLLAATDMIAFYHREWENKSEEIEIRAKSNRHNREAITAMSTKAKVQMMENHIRDKDQITILSVESYEAIKKLGNLLTKGQKVLQMDANCKKHEMEGENVPLWNTTTVLSNDLNSNMTQGMKSDVETYEKMENVWLKLNRVNIHIVALKNERSNLRLENRRLKQTLKNFLVEAALGTDRNMRAEVSGRPASMKMYRIIPLTGDASTIKRRPVTCIEASTCNAVVHARRMNQWKAKNQENSRIFVRKQCW